MTEITINPDQTLSVRWAGKPGRGSLFQIMAEGNAKLANQLDLCELWAVLFAAELAPFPLGAGESVYREALKEIQTSPEKCFQAGKMPDTPLGELRQALVYKAESGCNAPTDSYLRIAAAIKTGDAVPHY